MMPEKSKTYIFSRASTVFEYAALTKPELTLLSVLTAVCSASLASSRESSLLPILHAAVGTFLVGGGAGTLNQYFERTCDAKMKRTQRRTASFGNRSASGCAAFRKRMCFCRHCVSGGSRKYNSRITCAHHACLLCFCLHAVETKDAVCDGCRRHSGRFASADRLGCGTGRPDHRSMVAVLILFFWQMPHFLSLAWIYRNDCTSGI